MKVEFYRHDLGSEEFSSVVQALNGIFLTAGPMTERFENEFASFLNCRRVVGTSSCTSALYLSLKAFDIGHEDEVITTPMSFIATSNTILQAGARPVFVDVEKSTGNISVEAIEQAIGPKTKAILPVHLYGHMCDMKGIRLIADRYGLFVIEDAAHCIEGEREGIRPGQLGDVACFSFYATKNLTSGEGGAIATNHEKLADKLMLMRSHGMDKNAAKRYTKRYRHWDMVCMGYKANMCDIQAALLIPQLARAEKNLEKREKIYKFYERAFAGSDAVEYPRTLPYTKHARHLFTIWVAPADRDELLFKLQDRGIGVAVNYRPIHLLSFYRERFGFSSGCFPVAEQIGNRTITLPLYPSLTEEAAEFVVNNVLELTEKR